MTLPAPVVALLLALLLSAGAYAQDESIPDPFQDHVTAEAYEESTSLLMLTVGPRLQQSVEQLLFGRRDDGVIGHGSLAWLLVNPESKTLLEGRIEADAGVLTNSWAMPTETYDLALLVRGVVMPEKLPLAIGGYVRGSWSLQFRERLDESHTYWLTAYELGPSVASGIPLSKSLIALIRISAPLVALVSRPEHHRLYNNDLPAFDDVLALIHRDLRIVSIGDYAGVDIELDVPVELNEDWLAQTFGYRLLYRTGTDPKPVSYLSHMLTLSLLVRL